MFIVERISLHIDGFVCESIYTLCICVHVLLHALLFVGYVTVYVDLPRYVCRCTHVHINMCSIHMCSIIHSSRRLWEPAVSTPVDQRVCIPSPCVQEKANETERKSHKQIYRMKLKNVWLLMHMLCVRVCVAGNKTAR